MARSGARLGGTHARDQDRGGGAGGERAQSGGFGGLGAKIGRMGAAALIAGEARMATGEPLHLSAHAPDSAQGDLAGTSQQALPRSSSCGDARMAFMQSLIASVRAARSELPPEEAAAIPPGTPCICIPGPDVTGAMVNDRAIRIARMARTGDRIGSFDMARRLRGASAHLGQDKNSRATQAFGSSDPDCVALDKAQCRCAPAARARDQCGRSGGTWQRLPCRGPMPMVEKINPRAHWIELSTLKDRISTPSCEYL